MSARLGDFSFFFPPSTTFLAVEAVLSATFPEVFLATDLAFDADFTTDSLVFVAAFFEEARVTVAIDLALLVAATLRFLVTADAALTTFLTSLAVFFALVEVLETAFLAAAFAFAGAFLAAAFAFAGAFLTLLPVAKRTFFASASPRPAETRPFVPARAILANVVYPAAINFSAVVFPTPGNEVSASKVDLSLDSLPDMSNAPCREVSIC